MKTLQHGTRVTFRPKDSDRIVIKDFWGIEDERCPELHSQEALHFVRTAMLQNLVKEETDEHGRRQWVIIRLGEADFHYLEPVQREVS